MAIGVVGGQWRREKRKKENFLHLYLNEKPTKFFRIMSSDEMISHMPWRRLRAGGGGHQEDVTLQGH